MTLSFVVGDGSVYYEPIKIKPLVPIPYSCRETLWP